MSPHHQKQTAVLLILLISASPLLAAPRESGGNNKVVSKLQAMVNDLSSQRDQLKTDNAKITTELESLKGQLQQEKSAKDTLQNQVDNELNAQKASNEELHGRLEETTAKLREVVDKYNALNKAKNELAAEHAQLQNTQQLTSTELKSCEAKNVQMYSGAKEIIDGYQQCQSKGVIGRLIDSEPIFQFKQVEFETVMQEYEDKLNKQKYH